MYNILHNIDNNEITHLKTDSEFIKFVEKIAIENGDHNFSIIGISDAKEYIEDFCGNLTLLDDEADLFEHHNALPTEVKEIINKYGEQSMNYHECKNLIHELEKVGYTCEYNLDAVPYNLTKLY